MRCVPHNYRFKKKCIEFQNPAPWLVELALLPLGISSCSLHLRVRGIPVESPSHPPHTLAQTAILSMSTCTPRILEAVVNLPIGGT